MMLAVVWETIWNVKNKIARVVYLHWVRLHVFAYIRFSRELVLGLTHAHRNAQLSLCLLARQPSRITIVSSLLEKPCKIMRHEHLASRFLSAKRCDCSEWNTRTASAKGSHTCLHICSRSARWSSMSTEESIHESGQRTYCKYAELVYWNKCLAKAKIPENCCVFILCVGYMTGDCLSLVWYGGGIRGVAICHFGNILRSYRPLFQDARCVGAVIQVSFATRPGGTVGRLYSHNRSGTRIVCAF